MEKAVDKPETKKVSKPVEKHASEKEAKSVVKPALAKKVKKDGQYIKLKQVASGAGRLAIQNATLKGLGLGKIGRVVELEDTDAVRGMVRRVAHLIQVVE
ncbi:MAG: 50S ribosomal protein L30 [Proteobacteria bacterium]|nr:50S ribosomal protein L30 [Pseudomonadota bacterium]